ncbi:hypothetical protein BU24DRAFT_398485 [Aaosphaeria arxii CBS 175.79]|uniref:Transcription factor Rba50 n=1 Tax=Aaosphaeria arxii CBS 175.79 TaxID=1450172 RepID=A0A6A5XFL3_9PLEO|nr:uncharacterized protein BU24DRAFT_398485 [Aaosphaeria arxii CBS 175.79]KAF2011733.1 hypothetical protein BU24DRAFT_398485 [Aaosphaeria arxii CBS 175.79]
MSFARGERVHFDFDTGSIEPVSGGGGEGEGQTNEIPEAREPATAAFVGEIFERAPAQSNPPQAPSFKATGTTGFPAHKKRTPRVSAFKQQRAAKNEASAVPHDVVPQTSRGGDIFSEEERARIDEENNKRLAEMSADEIEKERNELLESLSPSLIQRLLARSNISDASNERELFDETPPPPPPEVKPDGDLEAESKKQKSSSDKKVTFNPPDPAPKQREHDITTSTSTDAEPKPTHNDGSKTQEVDQLPASTVHFPKPPQPPELDPDSPSFLEDLHEKYFPDLAYDPSSLSWMAPIDASDTKSPYHPSQTALNASELRFDFKGALLAPSQARELPVTAGLHHHAEAPEAAGYTIPELAILARSAVPAQRCMAYQTLGRILYRLGKGEFGRETEERDVDAPVQVAKDPNAEEEEGKGEENEVAEDEDAGSYIAAGLWNCIEEGRVIATLTEEAKKERGHLTAKTYAQEALWNWRRGGGRLRKAV